MSDTAIYDPRDGLTPTQLKAFDRAAEFRRKLRAAAKPDTPVICLSASVRAEIRCVVPVVPVEHPEETWTERQKRIHAKRDERFAAREPWFTFVEEIDPPTTRVPTVLSIQKACCDFFNITLNDFLSERRLGVLVWARQVGMLITRDLTPRSLVDIGNRFGGRDHTTVLYAIRKIDRKRATDAIFNAEIETIKRTVMENA